MNAQNKTVALALFAVTALTLLFVGVSSARAETICYTQYGGGETCITVDDDSELEVDKEIYNPDSENYEDNIKPTDGSYPYSFIADQQIKFRITVKNTGDVKIEDIDLEDILPSYVIYDNGDGDGEDDGTKVKFDNFDLDPGESKSFYFTAEVAESSVLPNDDQICLTNIAEAEGKREDNGEEESDVDYANFCIELPEVEGKESPETLPVTGDARAQYAFVLLTGSGLVVLGYGLKKLAQSI